MEFTIIYNVAAAGKKVTKGTVTVDNGIPLDESTQMGLPKANGPYDVTTTWNMVCEDPNKDLEVKVTLQTDEAKKPKTSATVTFKLSCRKPQNRPKVGDGGTNYVPPSGEDTPVPQWLGLLNMDLLAHVFLLDVEGLPPGWEIIPPLPPSILLEATETTALEFEVIVPADTPEGTLAELVFTATFEDDPAAQDSGTSRITVQPFGACCFTDGVCNQAAEAECIAEGGEYFGDDTLCEDIDCFPIPTVSQWGLVAMALVVFLAAAIVFRRARAARA